MKKILPHFFKSSPALLGYAAVLSCLISSGSVFAQSDTSRNITEVKVNASTMPAPQAVAPSQSVSANDFIHYNAFNVADAIRNFSGVIIKDYGGIGGLKTVSVRGLGANHIAVLYDGVQINDAENGQVDLGKLNLNGIQQITLYNGQPTVVLQTARAFASASVLSIETTKPRLDASKPYLITAGFKGGSFGLINPYLQWQQRLNNTWGFVINAYTENANGQYDYLVNDGANITKQSRVGSGIAAQQIDGALYWNNVNNKLNLHVNFYNSDRGLPGPVILYTLSSGQKLYNRDLFFQGSYEHDWDNSLKLLLNSKAGQSQLQYYDPQFQNTAGYLDQHFSQREYYQSAALAYHIKPNWEISYASDVIFNNMNADMGNFKYPTRLTLLNVLATNLFLGDWTLQGSLLNTNIHETVRTGNTVPDRNVFSPTLMASVKPFADKNLQIRAYYKYIFRLPTFNDQYYGFSPNVNLKPEATNQYDLGAGYTKSLTGLLEYIAVTADAYYNNVSNKIVFIPSLYNGSTQNFGQVGIKGLDVGVKTQAKMSTYKVSISANYSYQQALNITDPASSLYLNQLPYIPKHTIALNAGISRGVIGLYYNQVLSSSRYYDNDNISADFMSAYSVSDASVVYKGALSHFPIILSAEVNNLFNRNYEVVRSYPMPGRSYRFSFQITI